ncbi:MAG: glycosyltransferase [Candidatus Thermoplasmatota archaeon]|nr:glycosyltransferase [Candidatus Thermoplasmatota archaeon]
MRIGFFTETYYPTPDGVSHYLHDVKKELENRGHEVFVFSLSGDKSEANVLLSPSVPMFVYSQYRWPLNPIPFFLYQKVKSIPLDIIHIHDPFYMGSVGFRVAKHKKIPVMATFHTDFIRMKDSIRVPFREQLFELSWRYNIYLYNRCDLVTAPSPSAVEFLRKNKISNVVELPLFVHTDKFKPSVSRENKFVVQYIGRITKDKGIYNILDVADNFPRNDGVKFVISGTGPEEEPVKRMIKKMDLQSIVEMTGYLDEAGKMNALSNASIFLHPSDTDTFGIAVLEAMSCGKPAVVSNRFPLLNQDSSMNGMIGVDFSNPSEVAKKIMDLKQNRSEHSDLCGKARKYVSGNYNASDHALMLEQHYSELISRHKYRSAQMY